MNNPDTTVGELVERLLVPHYMNDADYMRSAESISETVKLMREERSEAADKLSSLQRELDAYRAALEPFAAFAEHQDSFKRGDDEAFCSTIIHGGSGKTTRLTVADLRRARAVLSNTGGHNG